jgi:hypothetical protein
MIKTKCKNCGKEVKVTPHRFDTTENICCSNQCRYEYRRKNNGINYILKNDHCEMIIKDKTIKIDLEETEKVQKYTWYNLGSADTAEQAKQLYDKWVLEDNEDENT